MISFDKVTPLHIAAVVFPTLCVFGSQFFGSGANESFASEFVDEGVEFEQSKFAFSLSKDSSEQGDEVSSPFYFERIAFDEDGFEPDELGPNPYENEQSDSDEPEIQISAILPNARNPLAIIDGKPRQVGDTLESGWTVMTINGDDFSVTFRNRSGKTIQVVMKKVP